MKYHSSANKVSSENHKRSRVLSSPLALFLVPILSSKGSASSRVGFLDMYRSGELSWAAKMHTKYRQEFPKTSHNLIKLKFSLLMIIYLVPRRCCRRGSRKCCGHCCYCSCCCCGWPPRARGPGRRCSSGSSCCSTRTGHLFLERTQILSLTERLQKQRFPTSPLLRQPVPAAVLLLRFDQQLSRPLWLEVVGS